MRRLTTFGAIALLALAGACDDDRIPLGIEMVGPQAPSSPGPQPPSGSGPGPIRTGGGADDVVTVAILPTSLTIQVGDSVQVSAAAFDDTGQGVTDVTFSWESSDTRVVRVRADPTQSGVALVTGVSAGSAIISATAGEVSGIAFVDVIPRR
jgi:hypothetical protein